VRKRLACANDPLARQRRTGSARCLSVDATQRIALQRAQAIAILMYLEQSTVH
jgi:hypothetical protein